MRHEVEPFVGYSLSVILGVTTLGICLWLGPRLGARWRRFRAWSCRPPCSPFGSECS